MWRDSTGFLCGVLFAGPQLVRLQVLIVPFTCLMVYLMMVAPLDKRPEQKSA